MEKICNKCLKPYVSKNAMYCSAACWRKERSRRGGLASGPKNLPIKIGKDNPFWLGGKERRKLKQKEWREKYPDRLKAHRYVSDAIRRGKLIKKPCTVCGNPKSEAHHEDYTRPKEIQWLCRRHHREADNKLGLGSRTFGGQVKSPGP